MRLAGSADGGAKGLARALAKRAGGGVASIGNMLEPMAVNMTIDLNNATFADLVALVDAARVAGVDPKTALELDGETLSITVEPTTRTPAREQAPEKERTVPPLGDAAIRSVVDILTGRQEPPRR